MAEIVSKIQVIWRKISIESTDDRNVELEKLCTLLDSASLKDVSKAFNMERMDLPVSKENISHFVECLKGINDNEIYKNRFVNLSILCMLFYQRLADIEHDINMLFDIIKHSSFVSNVVIAMIVVLKPSSKLLHSFIYPSLSKLEQTTTIEVQIVLGESDKKTIHSDININNTIDNVSDIDNIRIQDIINVCVNYNELILLIQLILLVEPPLLSIDTRNTIINDIFYEITKRMDLSSQLDTLSIYYHRDILITLLHHHCNSHDNNENDSNNNIILIEEICKTFLLGNFLIFDDETNNESFVFHDNTNNHGGISRRNCWEVFVDILEQFHTLCTEGEPLSMTSSSSSLSSSLLSSCILEVLKVLQLFIIQDLYSHNSHYRGRLLQYPSSEGRLTGCMIVGNIVMLYSEYDNSSIGIIIECISIIHKLFRLLSPCNICDIEGSWNIIIHIVTMLHHIIDKYCNNSNDNNDDNNSNDSNSNVNSDDNINMILSIAFGTLLRLYYLTTSITNNDTTNSTTDNISLQITITCNELIVKHFSTSSNLHNDNLIQSICKEVRFYAMECIQNNSLLTNTDTHKSTNTTIIDTTTTTSNMVVQFPSKLGRYLMDTLEIRKNSIDTITSGAVIADISSAIACLLQYHEPWLQSYYANDDNSHNLLISMLHVNIKYAKCVQNICGIIWRLCRNDNSIKKRFVMISRCCSILIECLSRYQEDIDTIYDICGVICILSTASIDNQMILGSCYVSDSHSTCCELLVNALQYHVNSLIKPMDTEVLLAVEIERSERHKQDTRRSMDSPIYRNRNNTQRFSNNYNNSNNKATSLYKQKIETCKIISSTICVLAFESNNYKQFHKLSLLSTTLPLPALSLIALLREAYGNGNDGKGNQGNSDVIREVCRTIWNLCIDHTTTSKQQQEVEDDDNNDDKGNEPIPMTLTFRQIFGSIDGCFELLIDILHYHLHDVQVVIQVCGTLEQLSIDEENRQRLGRVCTSNTNQSTATCSFDRLVNAWRHHINNPMVVSHACRTIYRLSLSSSNEESFIRTSQLYETIVLSIENYQENPSIVVSPIMILRNMFKITLSELRKFNESQRLYEIGSTLPSKRVCNDKEEDPNCWSNFTNVICCLCTIDYHQVCEEDDITNTPSPPCDHSAPPICPIRYDCSSLFQEEFYQSCGKMLSKTLKIHVDSSQPDLVLILCGVIELLISFGFEEGKGNELAIEGLKDVLTAIQTSAVLNANGGISAIVERIKLWLK